MEALMKTRGRAALLAIAGWSRWDCSLATAPRARPRERRRPAPCPTSAIAAQKTYVAPGDLDEYYLFSSGGHSGQVYVYGVPSMRHISTIPVFTPYPATGYGFDDESQGDARRAHVGRRAPPGAVRDRRRLRRPLAVHQRDERPRSRASTCATSRPSRSSGRCPNISGNHASSFVTPNTEYALVASRFSIPMPKGTVAAIEKYATEYKGVVAGDQDRPEDAATCRSAARS